MKKMRNITAYSLFICFSIVMLSCHDSKKPKEETPRTKAPNEIITTEQAQELFDNYSNRRAPLIQKYEDSLSKGEKFDVARYGYYDYKTIKEYIAYIEQEAKLANIEISTLRLYLGNYPNQKQFKDGQTVKHPRQNSFFIVPTLKKDRVEYPFSILSDGKGNYKAKLLTDNFKLQDEEKGIGKIYSEQNRSNASFIPDFFSSTTTFYQEEEESVILNESNMVPPPYK